MADRTPPHNLEAEQNLLGAVLLKGAVFDRVGNQLTPEHFYRHDHQLIWRAFGELTERRVPIDVVTVGEWFDQQGALDRLDGGAYLTMLANESLGTVNAPTYARMVADAATRRQLIDAGTSLTDLAMQPGEPTEMLTHAWQALTAIKTPGKGGPRRLDAVAGSWLDQLNRLSQGDWLETGLADLDHITAGMLPAELIVIAGRPSMGKTSMAMNIARHVGRTFPTLSFSLEMSAEQLLKRVVTSGGLDGKRLRHPDNLTDEEWQHVTAGIARAKQLNILVDDEPGITVQEMHLRAKRAQREHGIGLVLVDYLQLVRCKAESRFQEVSEISRGLKAMAKDLDVPVIAVSQLNRSLESRPNKRPILSDLRESGQLEQDADQILFCYRHRVYYEKIDSDIAEIIVGKHRDAETGTAYVLWRPERQEFVNAERGEINRYQALVNPDKNDTDDGSWVRKPRRTANA